MEEWLRLNELEEEEEYEIRQSEEKRKPILPSAERMKTALHILLGKK